MNLKRVELAWRSASMRAIGAALPGPRAAVPPDWGARPYRVLYLRYEAIGDMIMATGVIRAIARSHPTITVDVLASERNHEALHGNPHVGRVLRFAPKRRRGYPALMRALRAGDYDVVVDGRVSHGVAFTTTPLLMAATRAPLRVGAARTLPSQVYNVPVPFLPRSIPYVERTAYLAEPFGVDRATTDFRPELFLAAEERAGAERVWAERAWPSGGSAGGRRLLVNLSASDPLRRRWPDERFVAAVRHARTRLPGLGVLVIAVPTERAQARAVAEAVGGAAVETPHVRAAFALVGTADFVLTPDTSIAHAAAAFDRPAVVLIARPGLDFAPHYDRAHLAVFDSWQMRDLPVPAVTAQLDAMLARAGGPELSHE